MKPLFFTPGPSQLYPTFNKHLQTALAENIASISHRGEAFHSIVSETIADLKRLLKIPKEYRLFFLASSLESMERIIENCVYRESFHFINGAFSRKFFQMALELGKKSRKNEVQAGEGNELLTTRISETSEVIVVTHNETSTGCMLPLAEICALRSMYPQQLIAVDIVSSAPYGKIDFSCLDLAFFSVQKGFGMPAGLSVLIVSPAALTKARWLGKKNIVTGSYHRFSRLDENMEKRETPETPNVLYLTVLGQIVKDMLKKGRSHLQSETEKKAKMMYAYFGAHKIYSPFIKEKKFRSTTTIVIDVKGKALELAEKLQQKQIYVGKGYGVFKNTHL
ncbi:alanine--glyoxylate aminotransferase family protein, partial [Candidatus Roizmanbacteria bacterium]|nr:alanine--glyoxylate aminotransferase family protein [Candidatus Roizmanbacteria bacterium]